MLTVCNTFSNHNGLFLFSQCPTCKIISVLWIVAVHIEEWVEQMYRELHDVEITFLAILDSYSDELNKVGQ